MEGIRRSSSRVAENLSADHTNTTKPIFRSSAATLSSMPGVLSFVFSTQRS